MRSLSLTHTLRNLALLCILVVRSYAAEPPEPTLKLGDPAPKLAVSRWVQGDPVTEFARDKVYLLEFWATWCGPCRDLIPHMNEIHLKYRDRGLVVIGQNVWEDSPAEVDKFLKKMGSKMTYRVAIDDGGRDGVMAKTWLTASGQEGIPSAILVSKDGRIAWIGYGMELKESTIESLLAGTYDITQAAAQRSALKKREAEMAKANRAKDWDKVLALLEEQRTTLTAEDWNGSSGMGYAMNRLEALAGKKDFAGAHRFAAETADAHPESVDLNAGLAWMIVELPDLENRDLALAERLARRAHQAAKGENDMTLMALSRVLQQRGKPDDAIRLQEEAAKTTQDEERRSRLLTGLGQSRFDRCVQNKDAEGAYRIVREETKRLPDEAMLHNDYAWRILITPGLEPRDYALSEKLAARAVDIDKGENPLILDTLALAQFHQGKKEEAIKTQEKAVAGVQSNPELKKRFSARLESYKAGKAPTNLD